MAKWKEPDESGFEGQIRVINYVAGTQRAKDAFGNEGPETPIINYRIEQYGPWGWVPVPVYLEQPDGVLLEVDQ